MISLPKTKMNLSIGPCVSNVLLVSIKFSIIVIMNFFFFECDKILLMECCFCTLSILLLCIVISRVLTLWYDHLRHIFCINLFTFVFSWVEPHPLPILCVRWLILVCLLKCGSILSRRNLLKEILPIPLYISPSLYIFSLLILVLVVGSWSD